MCPAGAVTLPNQKSLKKKDEQSDFLKSTAASSPLPLSTT